MPVVFDDGDQPLRAPLGVPLPEERDPTAWQTIGNSFETNAMVEAVDLLTRKHYKSVPDYTPSADEQFKGTRFERDHWYNFVGSRSPEQTRDIIGRIEREDERAKVSAASGWLGTVADFASGAADPTILIPAGRAYGLSRAARSGAGALNVGAATGAAVALQEGVRQTAEETRTAGQSAAAIGGGVIMGGILGAAIGGLSKGEAAQITKSIDNYIAPRAADDLAVPTAQPVGAASAVREGLTLDSTLGADTVLARTSPVTRLQTNTFETARAVVRDMGDAGLRYSENAEFTPTSIGGTVETRVKLPQAQLAQGLETLDTSFAKYWFARDEVSGFERATAALRSEWARVTSQIEEGRLTFLEFKQEVSKAARRLDEHPITQVAEAAKAIRAKVFDPLGQKAVSLGVLKELGVTTAPSYLTRIYNAPKIVAQRNVWTERLVRAFKQKGGDAGAMPDAELRSLVDEVTNTILSESSFRAPGLSIVQGPRGPLRARVLDIADAEIEDFLENDIEKVARIYTKTMSADLTLVEKYGSVDLKDQLLKLQDEHNARANAAATDGERVKLKADYDAARRDIEALRDRVRNVYKLPDDPGSIPYRAAKTMQHINYMRLLGGMTIAAIPDLGRAVSRYGLTTVLRDGWMPLVHSYSTAKLAMREVKLAGTGLDMVLDTRAHAIADLFDDFSRTTKFERAVEGASARFGLVSLMAPWNATAKQITGVVAMSEILRATKAIAEGGATKKQITSLAASGIDEATAGRIWKAFAGDAPIDAAGMRLAGSADNVVDSAPMARPQVIEGETITESAVRVDGQTFTGPTHGDAFLKVEEKMGEKARAITAVDEGFITSTGRYVGRDEAAEIAARAEQGIAEGNGPLIAEEILSPDLAESAAAMAARKRFEDAAPPFQAANKATAGIGPADNARAARGGSGIIKDGVFLPNTEEWTDNVAREALRAAIVREVDNAIVTPGLEKPLWISTTLGRVLGQFKSFGLSSTQRVLLANLQQRDAATLQGVIMMLALGGLSAHLKGVLRDDKKEWTPAQWAAESFDASGLGAILMEANNISEKVTRGTIGLSALTGKQISRYQSRNALGALAGPSFDLMGDAIQVTGAASSGEWTASDTHAVRKMAPMQNLFYLRKLFDKMEDGYDEAMGVPDKSKKKRGD
jgi:hypothetical protein